MKREDIERRIIFCPKCWRKKHEGGWVPVEEKHKDLVDKLGKWETILKVCPDCSKKKLWNN